MTSRQAVNEIFKRGESTQLAFWTGVPRKDTVALYAKQLGIAPTRQALSEYFQEDCLYINPTANCYQSPEHTPAFQADLKGPRLTLAAEGCFADAEEIEDIAWYPWPDVKYCDFTETYAEIDKHQDKMIFTGMWSPFFHKVADFFGMENYFIKMYECPELVHEVTNRVVDYYVEANEKFFAGLGDRADVMFFGNDFGTQRDLLISPEMFRTFVLPSIKRLVAVGKKYNKIVMMHSCGAIGRIIPDILEAGVDVLHPLQARAAGMDADTLKQYKGSIAFVGGIDTQDLLVHATPQQIKEEVARVRALLGPSIVISPSHETILPNVPIENVIAMAEACGKRF